MQERNRVRRFSQQSDQGHYDVRYFCTTNVNVAKAYKSNPMKGTWYELEDRMKVPTMTNTIEKLRFHDMAQYTL